MKNIVKFFKNDNKWYADIPNHTLDENEMIMGSDDMLSLLADGKDEITILVSDEPIEDYLAHFQITEHDDDGAYYKVCESINDMDTIWVCNVTHDVFGEHPEDIYIRTIS